LRNRQSSGLASKTWAKIRKVELRTWEDYEDCSEWDDGFFDFCLVDGVKRLACVKSIIRKIRKGGYLFLLGAWVEAGIMGVSFWLAVVFIAVKAPYVTLK
jgi:hypothetical protein